MSMQALKSRNKPASPALRTVKPVLEVILKEPIYGNFNYDCPLLKAIDAFVLSEANTDEEKLQVLPVINNIYGSDDSCDMEALNKFVQLVKEAR